MEGRAPEASSTTSGYIPALDGLRAFAVLAVIAFHTNLSSLPGSYFGVDTFFTLSGFLITSLLVAEWTGKGRISLTSFWARRARRLLPALFVMLTAVGVIAALWPQTLASPQLLGDAIATVFYSANWHLIAEHSNYFAATGQPSPLLHTWSLAIEEQFYVVWPLLVLFVLRGGIRRRDRAGHDSALTRRHRLWILLAVSAGGAVASAVWMAAITHQGSDTARSYYGSDTRAQAILVGAALAVATALLPRAGTRRAKGLLAAGGLLGLAGTSALWAHVPETSLLAFHGGFFLAALSTAAIIACVTQIPGTALGNFLSVRPLRYLGRISYGMYLWYLPMALILSGPRTHLEGYPLFGLRIVVVVAVASVSAYAVEMPIRRGSLRSWRATVAIPMAAAGAVLTVFLAGVLPGAADAATSITPLPRHVIHAVHGPKVKVLVVGDSVAGTLGVGLSRVAASYDAVVVNEGSPGCSLSMDQSFQALWSTVAPGTPCQYGNPDGLLARWRSWVDRWNPDVVVYVARGEVFNQEVAGRWEHLGDAAFDSYVTGRFESAVSVLGSRGAHVVLLTSPYYDSGVQVSGAPWPEDNPARVAIDNRIIESVGSGAASAKLASADVPDVGGGVTGGVTGGGAVSAIALGRWLSPGGRYAADVGGVNVRCGDGVHFTVAGGEWVAARLLPQVVAMGRVHQSVSAAGTWPTVLPQPPPAWYAKLPCGSA
ncbi:MAG TPA: acyltransferase family protein [Acidimicrobiales bacterium]|nr:acyltransferase family protein [Acidimicrobiales bacterium]